MKKLFLALMTIASISFFNSCTKSQAAPAAQTVTSCQKIIISADAERIEVIQVMMELMKDKYKDHPKIDGMRIEYQNRPRKVDGVPSFYINNVGIKYSNEILRKSQKIFGDNSSLSSRCQMTELDQLSCKSQLIDFEKEFVRVLNGCTQTTPTPLVTPIVTKPVKSSFAWAPFFMEWGQNLLWLFLFLLLLFLLWHLLSWLWNNRPALAERQTWTNQHSTEQKETLKQVSKNCCSEGRLASNILMLREVADAAGDSGKVCLETNGCDVKICVDKKPTGFSRAGLTAALAEAIPECSGDTIISIVDSFNETQMTRLSNKESFNAFVETFKKMK